MNLSSKVLVLTVIFVMLAELLIYVPSIARFRKTYLARHLEAGHLAVLTLEAAPRSMVTDQLRNRILFHADALGVAIGRTGARFAALSTDLPPVTDHTVDLERESWMYWISGAFETLLVERGRVLRIKGVSPKDSSVAVEVQLREEPLRQAMFDYSGRILQLSLLISILTGALLFLALQWLMIRPMRRLTRAMVAFHESPEGSVAAPPTSLRNDEIGTAEREFYTMRNDVRTALRQQARLAALGGAVAKINHDLRASLATAVLVSDRLAASEDPEVREITPRFYESIGRAVDLCSQTLDYASQEKVPPRLELVYLADLLKEVSDDLVIFGEGKINCEVHADIRLQVEADPRQIHRALANLGRNAVQSGATRLTLTADGEKDVATIRVADNGPGMPRQAMDRLFEPFTGAGRRGGTGLGLVIALEIAQAHGGNLKLEASDARGTTFVLSLPRAVS